MRRIYLFWVVIAILALPACFGQAVVSVKAGLIHYVEGDVSLDGKAVAPKFGQFPEVKANGILKTASGRAEILLSPGVFLRVGEDSSFKMISTKLEDVRLELLTGSVLVECAELNEDTAVTFVRQDSTISLKKNGLYRLESDPAQLLVYDGRAEITAAGQTLLAAKGRRVALDGELVATKFDTKLTDSLYRWSNRRAGYMALANVSSAKAQWDRGFRTGISDWYWNPYLGMVTFIPGRGTIYSPFGYSYYSPRVVYYAVYAPPPSMNTGGRGFGGSTYNPQLGYNVSGGRSYDGGSVAASSGPSAAPAPAASPRGGEASSGRGGEGGGRNQ